MTDTRDDRVSLFKNLESPDTQERFWEHVADDVDWTVEGTHPLAGRYHGKEAVRAYLWWLRGSRRAGRSRRTRVPGAPECKAPARQGTAR
jgi:ketosteroid isomerase-like protein